MGRWAIILPLKHLLGIVGTFLCLKINTQFKSKCDLCQIPVHAYLHIYESNKLREEFTKIRLAIVLYNYDSNSALECI